MRTIASVIDVVITGASDTNFPEISVEFEVKRPDGTYLLDATAREQEDPVGDGQGLGLIVRHADGADRV